ncbi:MAG TPA: hypothetical protein VMN43_01050 [Aestuariivirgaceae bacterium]|nr:hypothetical protein [Aestuariivirgaceae bacterium]
MPKNRFEQVDETQPDAITLRLSSGEDQTVGTVTCPAALTEGRFPADLTAGPGPAKDAFRHAVKLANEFKAAVVVVDPDSLWEAEWGELYRPLD